MQVRDFRRLSVAVLGFTLAVILWGAYVRASGSGAGCGSHWPTCNGQVLPRTGSAKTLVEFTHRLTSGLAFLGVLAQLVLARRCFPRGHLARRAAGFAMALMVTEALIGAGLVRFEMVAGNKSLGRGWWMTSHLVNTFALVAALTLVAFFAKPARPATMPTRSSLGVGARWGLAGALAAVVIVAMSGAVAALGDTLFPSASLREGLAMDLSPTAHLFVRLRVLHPVLAVLGGAYVLALGLWLARTPERRLRGLAQALAGLVLVQFAVGVANLALLAPIPLQLAHLLVADLLWMLLVWITATVWQQPRTGAATSAQVPDHRAYS